MIPMDLQRVMARVRDACVDDVKATIIKEKKLSIVCGDFHKPKSNPSPCTNLVGVPVLGRVILDLL